MAKQSIEIPEPIRKIDIVLSFLARNEWAKKDGIEFNELLNFVNALFEHESPQIVAIDNNELWKIFQKLKKDGLGDDIANKYEATYEGMLTVHLGGYRQKYLDANRGVLLQNNQMAIQRGMFWLTVFVAIGTIAAALYYLTKLYWEHGWFHSFW